ncbi:MFS monocarboxylate transporter [Aspergillus nomiae NRRL 13137]|uniref:MFS monocarboxylate transporter n=1 Tax=Aspergillus nomiae NRRL (strain ATCC 15546 / NRRL 13137 / CBS 260.88 / M93) TaxID=1509407 RepID=A0A0L1J5D4_ASPN3|nr:MFS monocarboxylate transporter [Aspergillus nomiae NRRL 13137]KNG87026.1 MFS monocarboxylate transporter [Aspergillus nomiae NRRL 13137]
MSATVDNTEANTSPPKEFTLRSTIALIGAFMALFCTLGFQNAFGVFQAFYHATILRDHSEFDIAWIGSLLTFMIFSFAAPAGVLVDRVGPTGAVSVPTSPRYTARYRQRFLLCPAMATVTRLFDRHRGAANGIMIAGSSIGGIIWPIMLDQLLNKDGVSFGWTFRIVGFVVLPLCLLMVATIRPAPKTPHDSDREGVQLSHGESASDHKAQGAEGPASIIKNPTFLILCAGLSVATFGLFSPLFFISTYAAEQGLSVSLAFYLVSMLNGASMAGRISTGFLADRYGNFNLCFLTIASSGLIAMCWTKAANTVGIIFFALAYGYTSGAMFSLQTPCAAQLSTPESRGAAVGILFVAPAIPGLVGTPISGRLLKHGYLALSMYSGAALLAGAGLVLIARCAKTPS